MLLTGLYLISVALEFISGQTWMVLVLDIIIATTSLVLTEMSIQRPLHSQLRMHQQQLREKIAALGKHERDKVTKSHLNFQNRTRNYETTELI